MAGARDMLMVMSKDIFTAKGERNMTEETAIEALMSIKAKVTILAEKNQDVQEDNLYSEILEIIDNEVGIDTPSSPNQEGELHHAAI
jgi:hypothetical protein